MLWIAVIEMARRPRRNFFVLVLVVLAIKDRAIENNSVAGLPRCVLSLGGF